MYTLSNDQLTVSILDPVADQARFGVRYCTGGYIFQVSDPHLGDLMSGPTYPDSFNWFDGQGIPDAFNLHPLRDPKGDDSLALILGIGLCNLTERTVTEFCAWDVEESADAIRMTTRHAWQSYDVTIERTVSLHERTVRSDTRVVNGGAPLPIRWFPHPFYPQPDSDELLKVNIPVAVGDDVAYELAPSGFIRRKGWPWQRGYYLALDHTPGQGLSIFQRHPLLGTVTATCSYNPTYFPIWGNPITFSWEPFLERTIGGGRATEWRIDYDF